MSTTRTRQNGHPSGLLSTIQALQAAVGRRQQEEQVRLLSAGDPEPQLELHPLTLPLQAALFAVTDALNGEEGADLLPVRTLVEAIRGEAGNAWLWSLCATLESQLDPSGIGAAAAASSARRVTSPVRFEVVRTPGGIAA